MVKLIKGNEVHIRESKIVYLDGVLQLPGVDYQKSPPEKEGPPVFLKALQQNSQIVCASPSEDHTVLRVYTVTNRPTPLSRDYEATLSRVIRIYGK